MRAIQARGGKVVVVDPRRSESAREADEHVAIRPGSDALLLLAMVRVLDERGRIDLAKLDGLATGFDAVLVGEMLVKSDDATAVVHELASITTGSRPPSLQRASAEEIRRDISSWPSV